MHFPFNTRMCLLKVSEVLSVYNKLKVYSFIVHAFDISLLFVSWTALFKQDSSTSIAMQYKSENDFSQENTFALYMYYEQAFFFNMQAQCQCDQERY